MDISRTEEQEESTLEESKVEGEREPVKETSECIITKGHDALKIVLKMRNDLQTLPYKNPANINPADFKIQPSLLEDISKLIQEHPNEIKAS